MPASYAYPISGYHPSMPQQSYSPQPTQQVQQGIIWVDGEVGAKAYQMPAGWPVGTPIPLWGTNDQGIYLKSMNQMGMPNPLQKIHYQMEEMQQSQQALPVNGTVSESHADYVTKDDLNAMRDEIKELLRQNQNGSNSSSQNRGGNR